MIRSRFTCVLISLLAVVLWADQQTDSAQTKVSFSGGAGYEFGQIYRGYYHNAAFRHRWASRALANLGVHASVGNRLEILVGLEAELFFSHTQDMIFRATLKKAFNGYIDRAEGILTILDVPDRVLLSLRGGYFPYKYNANSHNLGEYLFRSHSYPTVLFTEFDFARTRLLGLGVHSELLGIIDQDLLITSSHEMFPLYDISIAYLASARFRKILDLGVGVNFDRLLSVDEAKTTPRDVNNIAKLDTAAADTLFYTFRSAQLMGRFCFDPKGFMKTDLFGEKDLRLYLEFAILGWENYPGHYEERWQRMPVTLGFNFPTFKILDVLSLEAEYFRSPYPNSHNAVMWNLHPWPTQSSEPERYQKDDWKWSLFAEKTVVKGFSVIAQAANDHLRIKAMREEDLEYEETLRSSNYTFKDFFDKGLWHWMIKLKYEF